MKAYPQDKGKEEFLRITEIHHKDRLNLYPN